MRYRFPFAAAAVCAFLALSLNACQAPVPDQAIDNERPDSSDPSTDSSDDSQALPSNLSSQIADTRTFQNPIVGGGADPWVVYKDGWYYYCTANGNNAIYVAKTKNLLDIGRVANKRVFLAPPGTDHSAGYWAAELHFLDGKWYIYYAASDGPNENHRMFVLESQTDDAMGNYTFKGRIGVATDRWAIDGTVLESEGKRYFVWSGWDEFNDYQQNLYIAPMTNPWTLAKPTQDAVRVEAENAVMNRVTTRSAGLASNGRVVGGIDFADSSLDFTANVPTAGAYQIDIRYSNGTSGLSTHQVTVNGALAATARYTPVGWENFQTTQVFVNLTAGVNTFRFTKGDGFAELDRFELKHKGSDRILLSMPEFNYEKLGGPAYVNEGPQILQKNGRTHVIFSASGSWTDDYNLVQLSFQGGDILDRKNWVKRGSVFAKTDEVFGPGHASFTQSPDGKENWIVYHAAKQKGSGWDRNVRTQPFTFDPENNPVFGRPLPLGTLVPVPSGTP